MVEQPAPVRKYNFDRVVRMVLTAGVIVALFMLLRFLSDVLIPFAIALLLAYLLNPIVNAFQSRLGGRRLPAVLITVFSALVVLAALLIIVVPVCVDQVQDFGRQLQQLKFFREIRQGPTTQSEEGRWTVVEAYREFHERQSDWAQSALDRGVHAVSEALTEENLAATLKGLGARIAPGLWGLVSGLLSFLLGLTVIIVILIYLIFLLLDYERVAHRWPSLLPPTYRQGLLQFVDDFSLAMRRYFRGQFLVALLTGILFAIGFGLIGLRLGILLGLFMGMLNMVPYLQAVGLAPAAMLAVLRALENRSSVFVSLLLVFVVFVAVQLIQDTVLSPKIMGKATGLRPWTILLGVFIWGKLLGFLGLLLAIPMTCMVVAYYSRFVLGKLDAKVIEDEGPGN